MAYSVQNKKGQTYYLHGKVVVLRGDRKQQIYYFAREVKDDALEELPAGYVVSYNERTGLPLLRKEVKKD